MSKFGRTKQHIKYLSCAMAVLIGVSQPWAALAVEEQDISEEDAQESEQTEDVADTDEVKYITGFEEFAEEDSYFPCMYKPGLEELLSVFPETIYVWLEGEEDFSEIEVTWECEEDFDATQSEIYVFYPKWDETVYAIADEESVEIPSITVEVPVESGIISDLEGAKSALKKITGQKSILALVYLCDEYEIKKEASYDSGTIHTVYSGQSVQITGVELGEYGEVWYQVLFYLNATEYTGYVEREYLATSDEDFADWEDTYLNLSAVPMVMAFSAGYPDVDQFPASYQNALYALKDKHPNWTFVKMNTGLDWNTAIAKEMGDKSLIISTTSGSWQNGSYGQGWSYASEGILKYYMDPRNFLSDPYIFQFEQLTYNESYHTMSSVQEVIKNSFMSSTIPGDSRTYAQAFTEIGQKQNISPFHLAARVLQEQGTQGTSPLISGTYSGYEGYYNYFNVEAAGKTNAEVIINGLKRAVASGWNTRFKSLEGGAIVIGSNYITKGQDTIYLEKFNVSNGKYANFTHQYMQNIQAPASEAANIRKAYNNAGALENSFVFKIPVYNNMPAYACSKPETTDSITLNKTTGSLEVNKTMTLVPYVNGSKVDYISNMTFTSSNTSVAKVDSQGKITAVSPGTATISCTKSGANTATCTVTVVKANPSVQTPVLSPYTYYDGMKLSDIVLPDGWAWEKGNTQIAVGTFSCPALYTPSDTVRYNVIKKEISFTVTKAIPECKVPERLEAKAGALLGDVALPSGFTWESNTETELKEAGEYTFYVSYNPNVNNYFTVENLAVIVIVTGKAPEPSTDDKDGSTTPGGGTASGGSTSGTGGTTTGGSTSGSGSSITGGGSTSSGSSTTGGGGTTTSGSTTTGGGSTTSSGSTTTGGGSTTSGGSTTGGGNTTSSGSTSTGGGSTSSSGSATTGGSTTSSGSTTTGGSTTSGGSSTTGGGSTSSGSSTTTGGSTSSGGSTTTGGSTSSSGSSITGGSTSSSGSTSTGGSSATGGGSTSSGSSITTGGNTSTGGSSTTGDGSTSGSGSSTTGGSTSSSGSSTTGDGNKPSSGSSATGGNTSSSGSSTTGGNTSSSNSTTTGGSASGGSSAATGGGTTPSSSGSGNTAGANTSSGSNTATDSNLNTAASNNTSTITLPGNNSAAANQSQTNNNPSANGNGTVNSGTPDSGTAVNNSAQPGTASGGVTVTDQTNTIVTASNVRESASSASFKPSVTMQMEDTTILTIEKLQMAKEQNFNLMLDMGNSAKWSIDTDSVDLSTVSEVDMGITFGTENIPTDLIAEILDGNKYLEFTLNHNGEFGFDPVLSVALDPANSGKYANLFYHNPEAEALEYICSSVIDENGVASFEMDHASSYVIIVSDAPMSGILVSAEPDSNKTGWIVGGVVCLILIVVGGVLFFYKKRKSEDEEDSEDNEERRKDEEPEDEDEPEEDEHLEDEDELEADENPEGGESEDDEFYDEYDDSDEYNDKYNDDEEYNDEYDDGEELSDEEEDDEESDWIEDEDWHEPEPAPELEISEKTSIDESIDDDTEDEWIDDEEWERENEWVDDEEWEKMNGRG